LFTNNSPTSTSLTIRKVFKESLSLNRYFQSNLTMDFNPRMSMARGSNNNNNQRGRQQDESDAFMTLVPTHIFKL